jgi:hypothetical protein
MSHKIPRFKNPADYDADDYYRLQRTGQRPENPEWVTRRKEVLEDEGLEDDTEVTDPSEMTPAQHLKRLQGDRPMSTTDTPPIENPRFVLSGAGGISGDILLPDGLSCIPDDVRLANDEAVKAFEKYQIAERELRAARTREGQAAILDASADASAAALNRELPTEQRATIKARESRLTCARALEATKTNARNTQFHLAKTIARRKPTWQPEQDAVVEAAASECRDLLGQLTVAYAALEKERLLKTALGEFPVQGSLVGVRLGRVNPPITGTPTAIAELAELIDPPAHGNTLNSSAPMSKRVLGQK